METIDAVKKRRSIRKFKEKEVPKELISKILEAGIWAPSGMNEQPWEFMVVKDKEKLKQIREMYDKVRNELGAYEQDTEFIQNSTIIFCCLNTDISNSEINIGFAVQNILLRATDLGLGSVPMGVLTGTEESIEFVKELVKLPDNVKLVLTVAIGYPDEDGVAKERREGVVHWEEF